MCYENGTLKPIRAERRENSFILSDTHLDAPESTTCDSCQAELVLVDSPQKLSPPTAIDYNRVSHAYVQRLPEGSLITSALFLNARIRHKVRLDI